MPMTFVNIRGEPVSTAPPKQKKAANGGRRSGSLHGGYVVSGFSPAQLDAARRDHEAMVASGLKSRPFDEAAYMLSTAPRKVRPAPYQVGAAADQCAEMARKAGWKAVRVTAKTKVSP